MSCDLTHQYCDNGDCIDLCFATKCPAGQSCFGGACRIDACATVGCPDNQFCNLATGACKQNPCVTKVCPQGERCVPMTGQCEANPCATIVCPSPCFTCDVGVDGKGTCAFDNTQCSNRAVGLGAKGTGCGCDLPAQGRGRSYGGLSALVLGAMLVLRRRTRRASPRQA
jgi:hypothetical protein